MEGVLSLNNVVVEFVEAMKQKGKSAQTLRTYTYTLEAFGQWLEQTDGSLDNLTRFDVQAYMNHLEQQGKSASTVNKVLSVITTLAKWMKRSEAVEDIRVPEVRKARHIAPKSLERNERNKLLREIERSGNVRDIAIVYMLLHTGLRVSELVALDTVDVTLGERSGSVVVRNGKGNVERKVPLSKEVRLWLKRYLDVRHAPNVPALFLSHFKDRMTVRAVQHVLKKYGVHPHMLRHTFARTLVSNGIDIATVAELLGHARLETTLRYSKPTEKELVEAIDKSFGS
jgi:integrase/recombinase XerD